MSASIVCSRPSIGPPMNTARPAVSLSGMGRRISEVGAHRNGGDPVRLDGESGSARTSHDDLLGERYTNSSRVVPSGRCTVTEPARFHPQLS